MQIFRFQFYFLYWQFSTLNKLECTDWIKPGRKNVKYNSSVLLQLHCSFTWVEWVASGAPSATPGMQFSTRLIAMHFYGSALIYTACSFTWVSVGPLGMLLLACSFWLRWLHCRASGLSKLHLVLLVLLLLHAVLYNIDCKENQFCGSGLVYRACSFMWVSVGPLVLFLACSFFMMLIALQSSSTLLYWLHAL